VTAGGFHEPLRIVGSLSFGQSIRSVMLAQWQHHYSWDRPHAGIGGIPAMSKLKPVSHKNVLTLHT
jgi:hypothetical protein